MLNIVLIWAYLTALGRRTRMPVILCPHIAAIWRFMRRKATRHCRSVHKALQNW